MSGCTYLPAAGAIQAGAEVVTAGGAVLARYEIIEVTPAVGEALRSRPLDSLLVSFDHRPSSERVIGIGDVVSVSIWDAGSGGLFSGPLVADRFSAGSGSGLTPDLTRPGCFCGARRLFGRDELCCLLTFSMKTDPSGIRSA